MLDVRGMIANGTDPFETVVSAFDRLSPGQSFTLVVPFDPKPLIAFLARRGASTELLKNDHGDVRYRITSRARRTTETKTCPYLNADGVMDLRNLEPPEPMLQILDVLEKAASGTAIVGLLSRVPGHLITMLERRGVPVRLEEKEGDFVITMTKP